VDHNIDHTRRFSKESFLNYATRSRMDWQLCCQQLSAWQGGKAPKYVPLLTFSRGKTFT